MNQELEILDNGNQRRAGSKTFQLVLFIFACLGFVIKLLYSLYWYVEMSKVTAQFSNSGISSYNALEKVIQLYKVVAIGIFLHALLLFTGSLLLFLRRKSGIWLYLAAQLIFIVSMLLTNFNGNILHWNRFGIIQLLIFAAYFLIPVAFIVMNLINRRYWLNRKQL